MKENCEASEINEVLIAQNKLHFLKNGGLEHVAIRFMNEGEYRFMLANGIGQGLETNRVDKACFDECFLGDPTNTLFFEHTSGDLTNWSGILDHDLKTSDELMFALRAAHGKSNSRKSFQSMLPEELLDVKDRLWKTLSPKDIPKIDRFITDPSLYSKENYRALLNDVGRHVASERDENTAQYHIMAVFSPTTIGDETSGYGFNDWKVLRKGAKPSDLLAAYAMLPQKDLYKDMIELSSDAGELTHPIFDNQSILRWPSES